MPVDVAVSSPSFAKSEPLVRELEALPATCLLNLRGRELTESELVAFFKEAQAPVAIVGREVVTAFVLDQCPWIRMIAKYGVGLDNIDQDELARRGIELGWTGGVNRRAVAELVLGFALGHWRNLFVSVDGCRQGAWVKDGGLGLAGLTVGIVGFGHVGTELAAMLVPFGCRLLYCDIVDRSAAARPSGARAVTYDELLETADLISFHVPLTAATRVMFGPRELLRVKASALVINTARGSIVDFDATCEAVRSGRLGGFAADVFPEEPVDLSPWRHPRLYFTPHIGGNSRQAVLAMGQSALAHVAAFLARRAGG